MEKAINILMQLDRNAAKVEGLISDITSELYKRLLTK